MIEFETPWLYESVSFPSTPIRKIDYPNILKHQEAKTLRAWKRRLNKESRSICFGRKEKELQRKTDK